MCQTVVTHIKSQRQPVIKRKTMSSKCANNMVHIAEVKMEKEKITEQKDRSFTYDKCTRLKFFYEKAEPLRTA